MTRFGFVFSALATTTILCAPVPATAVPITGTYDVTFSVATDGNTLSDGPTAATVGTEAFASIDIPGAAFTSADFSSNLASDGTLTVSMLAINAASFGYPTEVTIELTNVNLADAGVNGPIANVVFDAATTDIGQFDGAADFSGPTVAFTDDSITIGFIYDDFGIAADGPFLYFDVSLRTTSVPLPQTGWLLATAFGALAVGTRARRRTSGHPSTGLRHG